MKRFIVLLAIILLLSACGGTHENIREDMAEDTMAILEIYDKVYEGGGDFSEEDQVLFHTYLIKYKDIRDNPDLEVVFGGLSDEEMRLLILVEKLIEWDDDYAVLPSDKQLYDSLKEDILSVIKTGEI